MGHTTLSQNRMLAAIRNFSFFDCEMNLSHEVCIPLGQENTILITIYFYISTQRKIIIGTIRTCHAITIKSYINLRAGKPSTGGGVYGTLLFRHLISFTRMMDGSKYDSYEFNMLRNRYYRCTVFRPSM